MGTSNLICVVSGGNYRVAHYCNHDGYPEGQGAMILEFLRSEKVNNLRNNLDKCVFISQSEYDEKRKEIGWIPGRGYSLEAYNKFKETYPSLSFVTGAEILDIVAEATEEVKLYNEYDFSRNSLSCEWAYVIDFDANTFEVYEGYNKKPLDKSERFYSTEISDDGFYPVKLHATFSLDNLPDKDTFLTACEPSEEPACEPSEEPECPEVSKSVPDLCNNDNKRKMTIDPVVVTMAVRVLMDLKMKSPELLKMIVRLYLTDNSNHTNKVHSQNKKKKRS